MLELTDDVRSCDPLYGTPAPRELTDAEREDVYSDFLDSNGMDLLTELLDVSRMGKAHVNAALFVLRWSEKLEDAERRKVERL